MDKTLVDIRYYASDKPNETGESLPSSCSRFFEFPMLLNYWGARIAIILGSAGLSLGDFDHLYINYTNTISKGSLVFPERTPEKWLRYIDYGVSFDDLKLLKESELEGFIIRSTFECLQHICNESKEKMEMIKSAAMDVEKYGTEIELPVKSKKTKSYSVVVSYKLRPQGEGSYGIVTHTNHKTGASFSKRFIDLKGPSDIFSLVGSITVKNNKIVIKPRASFRANIYTNSYQVPMEVDINATANP
ncbi:MAG: hypothetical protein OEV64_11220 [Desulfobulbaceae bacterium]|nr:hypothetical protein [Desulfobulbaceae bacterium]